MNGKFKMKKLLLIGIFATTNCFAENVSLKVEPQPTGCRVATNCNIAAVHSISLQNTSNETRTYKVTYKICADNNDCKQHTYDVPVAPTHIWTHNQLLNLFTTFNRARVHQATYYTFVNSPWLNQQYVISGNVPVQ